MAVNTASCSCLLSGVADVVFGSLDPNPFSRPFPDTAVTVTSVTDRLLVGLTCTADDNYR